ncbi:hypothetical protein AVEN_53367-1 [Araneus ventricosus]|uniref:Uncharacterized protein n=1 Tax=Araneus ventricosus TaxID=182803 RepID=A0A4Y2ABS0_ARAVE|nr:hypothetical protein AVEN_53367-1 [Araneus ventricosus]
MRLRGYDILPSRHVAASMRLRWYDVLPFVTVENSMLTLHPKVCVKKFRFKNKKAKSQYNILLCRKSTFQENCRNITMYLTYINVQTPFLWTIPYRVHSAIHSSDLQKGQRDFINVGLSVSESIWKPNREDFFAHRRVRRTSKCAKWLKANCIFFLHLISSRWVLFYLIRLFHPRKIV